MCFMLGRVVSRGPVFEKMDGYLNASGSAGDPGLQSAESRNEARSRRLEVWRRIALKEQSIGLALVELGVLNDYDREAYGPTWFYGPPGRRYWPLIDFTHEIFTGGYRKAIEVSLSGESDGRRENGWREGEWEPREDVAPLPIYSQWVCGDDDFQCIVAKTPWQVTLTILTPDPPSTDLPMTKLDHHENVWVVGALQAMRGIQIVPELPRGPHAEPQVRPTRVGSSLRPPYVAEIYGENRESYGKLRPADALSHYVSHGHVPYAAAPGDGANDG